MSMMKKSAAVVLSVILCMVTMISPLIAYAEEDSKREKSEAVKMEAPSGILMEASTGKIIYEKSADTKMPPASVTKIMTMLLIFDALDAGKLKLEDEVTVSDYAASMGGSQVFLEPGETQTVDTMLKCIAVASANDACVAMSEYISGSEETFVEHMNERAKGLGMKNTHFVNCNGLDADGHLTTAHDIALMSRELITKYPKVQDYSQIWMENIVHKTAKGETEFGLSNTNKLIRHYEYATGLKTGSTSKAKFCISATARKNDLDLIAVVMAAPDSKQRVRDAIALFNYGFGKCQKYVDDAKGKNPSVEVKGGKQPEVQGEQKDSFSYVDTEGSDLNQVNKEIKMKKKLAAPIRKGEVIGEVMYYLQEKEIGSVEIVAKSKIEKIDYWYAISSVFGSFLL